MTTGENPIPERLPAAGTAGCGRARSSTRNITRFKQTIPDAEGEPGSIGLRKWARPTFWDKTPPAN